MEGSITADKVDIRSAGAVGVLVELTGIVDAVRTQESLLALRPRDGNGLRIGDRRFDLVLVRITPETALVRQETGARPRLIELSEVLPGEGCVVLGRTEDAGRVLAALVRTFRR